MGVSGWKMIGLDEQIFLVDEDAAGNLILDTIVFGRQDTERSYGRSGPNPEQFKNMRPPAGADKR
jgi:hypothetical protein